MHSSLFASLIDPAILLFFFGIFVGAIRSNLEIPAAAAKFCSLYLLLVVGFKGGVSLAATGFTDRKSTRLNSSHVSESRMPSSA